MFSSRLPAQLQTNRITLALEEARAGGRPLFDLTESNPTVVGLAYPEREILAALEDERALTYRPTPQGLEEARVAVAEHYARHGQKVAPEHVWLTASTSEAYGHLFTLLCDPGDRVIAPQPSYPLFSLLAGMAAVELGHYSIRWHDGWYLDRDALRHAADARTRALLVVHPNNPTGSFLKRDELEAFEALAVERRLPILSDEVFAAYARAPDPARVDTIVSEHALTFRLGGLSKLAGLPQLKLGWIVVGGPVELVAQAEARLELILDTFLSVNQPVQHAAARLLALAPRVVETIAARCETNRSHLAEALAGSAATLLPAEGGWYALVRVPRVVSEEAWVLALITDGVVTQPGFFYDFEEDGMLVVSLLPRAEEFAVGAARLRARVEKMIG